ncbi:AsnC family transcriptional regulator [Sphingobium sp. HBC34]|uniref:AsnC family transcriptional regulator n=1 Tax=Sphingobium cyanobacteriorum TaxID=3063954 RepID=A0ABT8ZSM8_9SPHN|nr:AsnC family transcriptional regulator [Sphingobium sp. HBC34]MDO7836456.1 AsnC family transcriptional regulator [Sphingobium sp. HBC34]
METELDETDWRIIEELQADARLRNNEIARRLGISEVTVGSRIRAMEDSGALRIVLQRNLGEEYLSVLLFINVVSGDVAAIARRLYEIEECLAVVLMVSDPDILMHVYVKDVGGLDDLINRESERFKDVYFEDMSISTKLLKFDNIHRAES